MDGSLSPWPPDRPDPMYTPGWGSPQEILDDLIERIKGPYNVNYAHRIDYFVWRLAAFIAEPACKEWPGSFDEYPQVLDYCIEREIAARWPETEFTPGHLLSPYLPWHHTQTVRKAYVTRRCLLHGNGRGTKRPVFTPGVGTPQQILAQLIKRVRGPFTDNYAAKLDRLMWAFAAFVVASDRVGLGAPAEGDFEEYPRVLDNCIQAELRLRHPLLARAIPPRAPI
jgi:hypothetical protein